MSSMIGPGNPIFYAQFNLRGGWKNTLLYTGGYILLIGGGVFLALANSNPLDKTSNARGWLAALMTLQIFIVGLYGTIRVNAAVRADVVSRMIESHRLMPMPAIPAVFGYIFGGPIQALALAAGNLIIGILTCSTAKFDLTQWVMANFMLLAFVILIWSATAQMAFAARGGLILMFIMLGLSVTGNGTSLATIPALAVLTAPIIAKSVIQMRTTPGDIGFAYGVALVSQAALAGVCVVAAARKFRSHELIGINALLGLIMLGVWVGISAIGLRYILEFTIFFRYSKTEAGTSHIVGAIISCFVIALFPISSACRELIQWRHNGGASPAQPNKPIPLSLVVAACAVFIGMIFVAIRPGHMNEAFFTSMLTSSSTILSTLMGAAMLLRFTHSRLKRAWPTLVTWLLITWIAPLLADVVYRAATDAPANNMTFLAAASPLGLLPMAWDNEFDYALFGMACQWLLVLPPLLLCLRALRMEKTAAIKKSADELVTV